VDKDLLDPRHRIKRRDHGCPRPMPVILDPDGYELWLDPGMTNAAAASDLLKTFDARQMRCFPESTRVNSVVNEDPECSVPVELAEVQDRLF
jgi:putative SOS response-associated peptidase YedK